MIKASDRNPTAKAALAPAPVPSAEPEDKALILFQVLVGGKVVSTRSFETVFSLTPRFEDSLDKVSDELPLAVKSIGRPGTRMVVAKVDKSDPDFVGREEAYDVGEVVSVPEVVSFLIERDVKTSAPLVRYYIDHGREYVKCGYTFMEMESFKKFLNGPTKKDYETLAVAHAEWCEKNQVIPFQ